MSYGTLDPTTRLLFPGPGEPPEDPPCFTEDEADDFYARAPFDVLDDSYTDWQSPPA